MLKNRSKQSNKFLLPKLVTAVFAVNKKVEQRVLLEPSDPYLNFIDQVSVMSEPSEELHAESTELEDLEAMRDQLAKLEEEKLNEIKDASISQMSKSAGPTVNSEEVDARSVYVGNLDYSATCDELQDLFKSCGAINRITILCDKMTGVSKGFAYLEFADGESVAASLLLNGQQLRGRALVVTAKRTNKPAFQRGVSRGRGRGRGRGGYGPVYGVMPPPYGFYPPPYGFPPRGRGNKRARYAPF